MNIKIIMAGLFLSVGSVLLTNPVTAQPMTTEDINTRLDHLYGTHDNYHIFFDNLKENIAKDNKKAVAAVVKYPLPIYIRNKFIHLKNPQQFIKNYDAIITPNVKKAIADQKFNDLIATYRGLGVGGGQIWFSGICLDKTCKDPQKTVIKIIGINNEIGS